MGDSSLRSPVFQDLRAGRDIVIALGGGRAAASRYAGKIQAFLEEYLVSEQGPKNVPFGGRDLDLDYLDNWLDNQTAPSRFALVAPAGRGKSALLVNWIRRLHHGKRLGENERQWRLVFVPISMRFNTNRPEVFYEAIAARLADILHEDLIPARADPAAYYEDQCRLLVDKAVNAKVPLLLIVDGLDEALGDRFSATWFPRSPGPFARLVVSARLQISDRDGTGWIRRLRWGAEAGYRAVSYDLSVLNRQGVGDLLIRTGAPLDVLASRPEITDKLWRLSEGEPLLLRFYVEDLWHRGPEAQRLKVEDLDQIKPGLGGYFDDWLARQRQAWQLERKEGEEIDEAILSTYLAAFACAYGPLTADELRVLMQYAHSINTNLRIEDALHPLRRFVIGTGRHLTAEDAGYVLSHPKLGEFLREDYFEESQIIKMRKGFTNWGKQVLIQLTTAELSPQNVSTYLLQYFSQHLLDANAPNKEFMQLVEEGWLRSWECFEGGYQGFSRDVRRAASAAQREQGLPISVASQLRCALVLSSISSVGSQIPSEVLVACAKHGLLSNRLALHWLEYQPGKHRAETLVALGQHLRGELALSLDIARGINDGEYRAQALAAIALQVSETDAVDVAAEALESIRLSHSYQDGSIAGDLAESVANTLVVLAPLLAGTLLQQALEITYKLPYAPSRAMVLVAFTPRFPASERHQLLVPALGAMPARSSIQEQADVLNAVAAYLGEMLSNLTEATLPPVIGVIAGTWDENFRKDSMVTLVSRLPAGLRASAVRIGAMIYSAGREEVLTALLRDVPDAQYSRLIQFAIESLADIETRERVRMRLIPYMRVGMISEVFEHYRTISNGIYHAEGLAALAPLLPKSLVGSCLECVRVLPNNYNRGRALSALMPRLTGPLLDRGFEALTTIDDPYCLKITVENFIKTVGLLPEFERSEFCDKLVQTVVLVPDVRYSVGGEQLLTQLIKFVPDLALKALQLGTRLQDDRDYAATLLAVAQGLSGSELARDLSIPDESFGQILERATAANGSERHIVEGLSAYSPYLSEAMFDALLNALVIISKKIRHENQPFSDPRYGPAHHPTIRSKLLRRMMQFYEASEEERPLIAETALQYIGELSYPDLMFDFAKLVMKLVPYIPEHLVGRALDLVQSKDKNVLVSSLAVIGPRLTGKQQEEILRVILDALRVDRGPSETVIAVMPHLPDSLLRVGAETAIEVAIAEGNPQKRGWALTSLISRLADSRADMMIPEVFQAIWRPGMEDAVVSLIADLPSSLARKIIDAIRRIPSHLPRAEALSLLAQQATGWEREEMWQEALQAAAGIKIGRSRAKVLARIAYLLPEADRIAVLQQALEAARTIGDDRAKIGTLATLSEGLPEPQRSEVISCALREARKIGFSEDRAAALVSVALKSSEINRDAIMAEALEAAAIIEGDRSRAGVLAHLAPHISEPLFARVLQLTEGMREGGAAADVLCVIAPRLSEAQVGIALRQARALGELDGRARALVAIGIRLPEPDRASTLKEALEDARAVGVSEALGQALIAYAPHVPESERTFLLREALEIALRLSYTLSGGRALAALCPHLPPTMRRIAIQSALGNYEHFAQILVALRSELTDAELHEILSESGLVGEGAGITIDFRARLAATLSDQFFVNVLQSDKIIEQYFTEYDIDSCEELAALAPHLRNACERHCICKFAEAAVRSNRPVLLELMQKIFPSIVRLEGISGLIQVQRAIEDASQWFH